MNDLCLEQINVLKKQIEIVDGKCRPDEQENEQRDRGELAHRDRRSKTSK